MPNIEIIRSGRKTAAIEISEECRIIIRIPHSYPESEIPSLLSRHAEWIEKAMDRRRTRTQKYPLPDAREAESLRARANAVLPGKVKYYSELTGLVPTGIRITSAKKRFGSCSAKNSLCFSYLLMRYPEPAIDYVVLHEIAHIRHHNHGKGFYDLVRTYMPDYRERERMLRS